MAEKPAHIVFAFVLLCFVGCGTTSPPTNNPRGENSTNTTDSFPLTITDARNLEVTLQKCPSRIVSLAPSITESLFAVGAADQVVGVTDQCNYPPEAKQCQKVGGFDWTSVSMERLVSLKPDLVVATGKQHSRVIERLNQFRIPVVLVDPESIQDVYDTLLLLGKITSHRQQAKELVASMKRRVAETRLRVGYINKHDRVRVFYQVYDEPLMTATGNTYIGEMIELAGGENIFATLEGTYPTVSMESLVALNPEVILAPTHGTSVSKIVSRPGASHIDAVKDNRVHLLNADIVSRPGPRLAEGMEQVARALYPEQFGSRDAGTKRERVKGADK